MEEIKAAKGKEIREGWTSRNKHDKAWVDLIRRLSVCINLFTPFDLEFVSRNNNPSGNSLFGWNYSFVSFFFFLFQLHVCRYPFDQTKDSQCFSWLFIINFEYESLPVATTCAGSSTRFCFPLAPFHLTISKFFSHRFKDFLVLGLQ